MTHESTSLNHLEGASVLVIGGAGFIGSHIVEQLLAQPVGKVVIYDNFARGRRQHLKKALADPRCQIFQDSADIRDLDVLDAAFHGIDFVYHLAAMWLLHCKDYPRTAFDVNIGGTFNVLEACAKHNIKKLIYSSSASVYGDAIEMPMTECHPLNNTNFYGATKISGEAMCTAFRERYDLNFVGLRYMNVYGPRQDQRGAYTGVIPKVLNQIEAGIPPRVHGDGSQAYDFIFVEDIARANILALQSSVNQGFYNVGTGVQTTIAQLCKAILAITESSLNIEFEPYHPSDVRQMVKNRIGCTSKSSRDLLFDHKWSLEEGLRELINWRKDEKHDTNFSTKHG